MNRKRFHLKTEKHVPRIGRAMISQAPAPKRPPICRIRIHLLLIAWSACGCTYSGGELLYLLGVGRTKMVEAKFHLTSEAILILIDDPAHLVDWPPARVHLFEELSQSLLRHEAARKIVPRETIAHLRQTVPEFRKRGAREIGEMAHAEQVLWINVLGFQAQEQIADITNAASMSVSVKVLNVLETDQRMRVRLWPTSPRGHRIDIVMSGGEVAMAKTKDKICNELTERMADRVARLFYDYRPGDFER